eukprot:993108-Rhodomonas_salina.2
MSPSEMCLLFCRPAPPPYRGATARPSAAPSAQSSAAAGAIAVRLVAEHVEEDGAVGGLVREE